jgi:hypothetical protein
MANYSLKYKDMFEYGSRVQRAFVERHPRNFFRISKYEYIDGDIKSLAGIDSSYIFVIGIYNGKINCIKLNEIRPDVFFNWLKTIFNPIPSTKKYDDSKDLADMLITSDRTGNVLFESKIKNSPMYRTIPSPYRTYTLDGLKYIQKLNLKDEILKELI